MTIIGDVSSNSGKNDNSQPVIAGNARGLMAPPLRWVRSRKAAVVRAINNNFMTEVEALHLYGITEQELNAWRQQFETDGEAGLSASALAQHHRQTIRKQKREQQGNRQR